MVVVVVAAASAGATFIRLDARAPLQDTVSHRAPCRNQFRTSYLRQSEPRKYVNGDRRRSVSVNDRLPDRAGMRSRAVSAYMFISTCR